MVLVLIDGDVIKVEKMSNQEIKKENLKVQINDKQNRNEVVQKQVVNHIYFGINNLSFYKSK
ncbi:hypothetical protein [Aquimarina sp. 2201CG14-23]|uniref:hypothetical protein n=1 Tax=Aquimarina mycalae TaxID=3040073 RepID=UPI002477F579|nr:hypothetical protein [Aquimarina sp. 2201CG14-23]MDH7447241.1 hypothetical protein [Aquimarina sp. 2201CG14-23]